MANNKRVFVPVFKDSIKPLRSKTGMSHTTVSMKMDGEKKYGELFFKDSDLKQSQKNQNMMLLGLGADRNYSVGFKDGTYSDWEYEKMTGQQISDANRAYIAEKQVARDSFQSKLDAGIAKGAQEAAVEPYTFTDGTNVYTQEELENHRRNVIDTFDWHTMDFDSYEEYAHESGLAVVENVLSYEMGQYFGDMTSKEKRQLIEMCCDSYIYSKPLAEGKLGVLMNLEGDMACSGYHIGWDSVSKEQENVFTSQSRGWNVKDGRWEDLVDVTEKRTEKEPVKAAEQAKTNMRIEDGLLIKVEDADIVNGTCTIPEGVTAIGNNAFKNCINLKNIEIPDGVTSIGSRAFIGCESLKNVDIPGSVTFIGIAAFRDCRNLEQITIPGSVGTIDDYAFYGCRNLKSVIFSEGVPGISGYAFIGVSVFHDCPNLETVTFQVDVPDYVLQNSEYFFESNTAIMTMPSENKTPEPVKAAVQEKTSEKQVEQPAKSLSERLAEKLEEKSRTNKSDKVASNEKAVVRIPESNIHALSKQPGMSYASIGLNSEHGTYGSIYFPDKALKTPRSDHNVRLLYLNPAREYNVSFPNPETNQREYHKMTGKEISDGNKSYLKERSLLKEAARPLPSVADNMQSPQSDVQFE